MFSFTKSELIFGLLSAIVVCLAVFSSRQLRITSNKALVVENEVVLSVQGTLSIEGLVASLEGLNVTFDPDELRWSARLQGWRSFQKGSYRLSGNYSFEVLLSKLARGIQDPVPLTILPGITIEKFAENVSNQIDVTESEMLDIFNDSLFLDNVGLSKNELFGRMLPETYLVYWTSSGKEIVRRVLREFNDKVEKQYSEVVEEDGLSIAQVLAMASIVEWEAYNDEEKSTISGLYWNRLNKRMMLQADPTVNFALGERRRLLFEDYKVDHPYNTYQNRGLPPGPITNPSLKTIEATVYPEEHDYIYMVANPEGGHIFTRTFEEHQVESEKWRRWLRQQYRIKRQREQESLND